MCFLRVCLALRNLTLVGQNFHVAMGGVNVTEAVKITKFPGKWNKIPRISTSKIMTSRTWPDSQDFM